ncbi:MAG: MFS transporter [Nocardioidaceae bacterium]
MSEVVLRHNVGQRRAWVVWSAAVSVYVLAVFHRTSLAVAGISAAERFHISASALASFTMVQLLVYAAMQIPVGVLLDRLGSKRMIGAGLALMTVGQLSFAVVSSYPLGLGARVLVGMGDAMVFVSVLRLVALWFPAAKSPIVVQLTGLLGQLGTIAAAVPMSHALATFGWTRAFGAAALVGVVLGVVLYVVVVDSPYAPAETRSRLELASVAESLRSSWAQPGTRLGLWTHFTTQFSVNVMGLLWGFPFLVQGQGLSQTTAGTLLTVMVVSSMVAGPLIGSMVARHPFNRSTFVLTIVAAIVGAWTLVLAWPGAAPLPVLVLLMVIVGVGGPSSMVGFDFARTFNPAVRLGSATGIVNIGGFVAALTTILGIGVVLDLMTPGSSTNYSPAAFTAAMSVQYVVWLVGGVQIWRYRRRTRRHLERTDAAAYQAVRHGDATAMAVFAR